MYSINTAWDLNFNKLNWSEEEELLIIYLFEISDLLRVSSARVSLNELFLKKCVTLNASLFILNEGEIQEKLTWLQSIF